MRRRFATALAAIFAWMVMSNTGDAAGGGSSIKQGPEDWGSGTHRSLLSGHWHAPLGTVRRRGPGGGHLLARTAMGVTLNGEMRGFRMYPTKVIVGASLQTITADLPLCINTCRNELSCQGVSWVGKDLKCTLKTEVKGTQFSTITDTFCKQGVDVPEPTPCPVNPNLIFRKRKNTDIVGNKLGTYFGNLKACFAQCQAMCACAGFVRHSNMCHLKTALGDEITHEKRTLYIRPAAGGGNEYPDNAGVFRTGFLGANTGDGYKMTTAEVATWCKAQGIKRLKLFHSYDSVIRGLAGIQLIIGIENKVLSQFAAVGTGAIKAQVYVANMVKPFPHVTAIAVGNEAFASWNTQYAAFVGPAMKNLYSALSAAGLAGKVKVVTPLDFACIFGDNFATNFAPVLDILKMSGAPFVVNPYPHYACRSNPSIRLDYCLGVYYDPMATNPTSMLDAQMREVTKILGKLNCPDMEVVVGETGWPTQGSSSIYNVTNQEKYLQSTAKYAKAKRIGIYLFQLQDGSSDSFGMLTNPGAGPKCVLPRFF